MRSLGGTRPSLGGGQGRLPGKGECWTGDTAQRVPIADAAGLGTGLGSHREVDSGSQSCRTRGSTFPGFRVVGSAFLYLLSLCCPDSPFPRARDIHLVREALATLQCNSCLLYQMENKSCEWVGGWREGGRDSFNLLVFRHCPLPSLIVWGSFLVLFFKLRCNVHAIIVQF